MQEEMARITIILIDTHKKDKTQWQCVKLLPSEKKKTLQQEIKNNQTHCFLLLININEARLVQLAARRSHIRRAWCHWNRTTS